MADEQPKTLAFGTVEKNGLGKYISVLDWLFSYQRDWLRFDIVAGVTAAAVVIPKAMAYATIAGLPVTGDK